MNIEQIKEKLKASEYDFLREDKNLGSNIILLTLGGSHAYGTNIEGSDVDIRGCALNSKVELLTNVNFEQFINNETDTVVYSFNKLISLLTNCNPNTIEILGCRPQDYLYLSPIGEELLKNRKLFLSKKAVNSFGGYANQQLRRLDNKAVRVVEQDRREAHILNSINNAVYSFKDRYLNFSDDMIRLYIDKSEREDMDTEIFIDANFTHYPLRDYKGMLAEMNNIIKDYNKIGKRNKHAVEHEKLGKHMMHLIRLYLMCLDILEKEEIITYREKEHDLLMNIRNEKYLDLNYQPISEFYEMVDDFEKKMEYAKQNTSLPQSPDYKAIQEFQMSVNERIIQGIL